MEIPPSLRDSFEEVGGIAGIREKTPKREAIARTSRLFHVLSDPRRLRIILILSVQSSCVCILKRLIQMSDSKLSYHLSVLKKNGLVRTTREGNWIVYTLTDKGKSLLPIIRGG